MKWLICSFLKILIEAGISASPSLSLSTSHLLSISTLYVFISKVNDVCFELAALLKHLQLFTILNNVHDTTMFLQEAFKADDIKQKSIKHDVIHV